MSFDDNYISYVHNCNSNKEIRDTLKMINVVSPSVEQELISTWCKEDECFIHKWFSKFRIIGKKVRSFVTNKYIRIKNLNKKPDSILKFRDENIYDF